VVTSSQAVFNTSCVHFGQCGYLVPVLADAPALAVQAADWAHAQGLWEGVGPVLLVGGYYTANADMMPMLQVIDVQPAAADAGGAAASAASAPSLGDAVGSPFNSRKGLPDDDDGDTEYAQFADGPLVARQLSERLSTRRRSTPGSGRPSLGEAPADTPPRSLTREFSKAA
jgi:hypothetical protein